MLLNDLFGLSLKEKQYIKNASHSYHQGFPANLAALDSGNRKCRGRVFDQATSDRL
jgi:hypothetical protein